MESEMLDSSSPASADEQGWIAVFSGGGFRGVAYASLLDELLRNGVVFKGAVGVSVGAIAAILLSAGVSGDKIHSSLQDDFIHCLRSLQETSLWRFNEFMIRYASRFSGLPFIGRFNQRLQMGILRWSRLASSKLLWEIGERLHEMLAERLGITTRAIRFKDLPLDCAVLAADLARKKPIVFGNTPESVDSEILPALVASCSVPFLFSPVSMEPYYLVDGGIICNLPIYLARSSAVKHRARTAAFLLSSSVQRSLERRGLLKYGRRVVETALEGTVAVQAMSSENAVLIPIDTSPVGSFEFPLTDGSMEQLLASGTLAAKLFLQQLATPSAVAPSAEAVQLEPISKYPAQTPGVQEGDRDE